MKQFVNWRVSGTIILVLAAALVILLGSITVVASPAADQEASAPSRTISVSGVGEASGVPDTASIQLGVDVQNPDPAQALADANSTIQQVEDVLQSSGIDPQAIQTASFQMWAQQDTTSQNGSSATGSQATDQQIYHVQDILNVTTSLDQAGSILDAAVAAGANNIGGLSFTLSDPAPLLQQARGQAIADAQQRAEQIAQLMGVTLGGPVSVSENVNNNPAPIRSLATAAAMTPVNGGQLSVTVNVDVSYAINS